MSYLFCHGQFNVSCVVDDEAEEFVQKKRLKGAKAREAAEAKISKAKVTEKSSISIPPPSLMVMEVVIPVNGEKELPSAASSGYTSAVDTVASLPPSSRASSAASSDVENGNSKPRLRKRNGGPLIVVSEDDSELEFLEPKAKSAKSKGKFKKAAKKAESSDYEVSGSAAESDAPSADEDEEDTQSFVDVSDNDQPKRKVKPKKPSKPARKAPSKKRKSASSDVEMDLDDDVATVKGKGKKRKSDAATENPAKKRKLREDTDPWKLESSSVRKDWKQMRSPPLKCSISSALSLTSIHISMGRSYPWFRNLPQRVDGFFPARPRFMISRL